MGVLAEQDERVYSMSPWKRWLGLALWAVVILAILGPWVWWRFHLHDWEWGTILLALAIAGIILPMENLWRRTLVLTHEGIELRGFHGRKSRLATSWKNVAAIRLAPRGAEGLVLKEPMTGREAEWLSRFRNMTVNGATLYDDEKRFLLGRQRFLPIDPFVYWIRHGDLWEQLREHAPWLAEESGQPAAYQPVVQKKAVPVNRPGLILAVAFIVALIAFGLTKKYLPRPVASVIDRGFAALFVLALGVYVINNLAAAFAHMRHKRIEEGVFWLFMALMQGFLVAIAFREYVWLGH